MTPLPAPPISRAAGVADAGVEAPVGAPGVPMWPLALAAGLLPLVATLLAWRLSVHLNLVPACNPFTDGCVSISRAAREGLPNHLFRSLMLPAATLQGLAWCMAAAWLRQSLGPERGLRAMSLLGVAAALALVSYASFLGTDGAIYRLLRQYGTVVYFGFTCLCMLLLGGAVQRLVRQQRLPLPGILVRTHIVLACTLVALGLVNALVAALVADEWKGRVENVTEWWGASIFVLCFFALAAMWWRCKVCFVLRSG